MDELRRAQPGFAAAVRWALFAEKLAPRLAELRDLVSREPPEDLAGQKRIEYIHARSVARKELESGERLLYPPDEVTDG